MDILIFPVIVIFLLIFIVAVSATSKNAGLDRSRRRPHGHVWPAHHDAGTATHQFQDTSGWEQQQHHHHHHHDTDGSTFSSDSGAGSSGDCGCGGGGDSGSSTSSGSAD